MPIQHVFSNTIAGWTGTVTVFNSQGSTATVAATNMVRPSDWNSNHNLSFTLAGAQTSVQSTAGGTDIQLSGMGGITLVGSTGTLGISGPPMGGPISHLEPVPWGNNSSLSSFGQSTVYLQHFNLPVTANFCRMNRVASFSIDANLSVSSNHTGGFSNSWAYSETLGLYIRDTGANSTNLKTLTTTSWSMGISYSLSIASGGATNMTLSQSVAMGFVSQIGTNAAVTTGTFSSTTSTSSAASSVSEANILSNVTGLFVMPTPFPGSSLSAGDYWLAFVGATGLTTGGTSTVHQGSISFAQLSGMFSTDFKFAGQTASNTSNRVVEGNGFWNAQTGAFSTPIAISSINNNSCLSLWYDLMNVSY